MSILLCSDFDYTLEPHTTKQAFKENLNAVADFLQNNKFCLVTGRGIASIKRVFPNYQEYCNYIITDGGAICMRKNEEILFQNEIKSDLISVIKSDCDTYLQNFKHQYVYFYDFIEHPELDDHVTKIRCWVEANQTALDLCDHLKHVLGSKIQAFPILDTDTTITWLEPGYNAFVDIMTFEASKSQAITRLYEMEKLQDEIITVGDEVNDLDMLKTFNGYAIRSSSAAKSLPPDHVVNSVAQLIEDISC